MSWEDPIWNSAIDVDQVLKTFVYQAYQLDVPADETKPSTLALQFFSVGEEEVVWIKIKGIGLTIEIERTTEGELDSGNL